MQVWSNSIFAGMKIIKYVFRSDTRWASVPTGRRSFFQESFWRLARLHMRCMLIVTGVCRESPGLVEKLWMFFLAR